MNRTVPRGDAADAAQPPRSPGPSPGFRPDHTAEMRAIALQLERLSGSIGGRESGGMRDTHDARPMQDGPEVQDGSEVGDGPEVQEGGAHRFGALRDAVAAIARRQADLDGAADGGRREAAPSPTVLRGERPSPARAAPPLAVGANEPSGSRRSGADLSSEVSQTFARFSRDLHDAIRAIDARPKVEALQQDVRQIGRALDGLGAPSPDADALALIGEQTREVRDMLKASTAASTARSMPLDAVERQVASLEARLGRLAAAPTPVAVPPDFGDTMAEVRALLGGFNPDATMAGLETRLDAITERIERGFDASGSSGLIEGLSRRVDELHASLRSQLAEAAVDTRPLEGLVRGLSERIGQARDASADFHQLEAAVRDVGAKIDGAAAGLDPRGVQAVESQLARLSERLDRSEASLRSLDGVEHTLGELFSQFEVTRQVAIDAAETAARTAARDTLRAALQNPSLAQRSSDIPAAAMDQMARSLDDIRALQDAAERRTRSALSDIQIAMDRLIGRMAASAAPADTMGSMGSMGSMGMAGAAGAALSATSGSGGRIVAEPAFAAAPDPADQMIEPGHGGSVGLGRALAGRNGDADLRAEPGLGSQPEAPALPPNVDGDGPASFIAAARRAAQAAQASAASTAAAREAHGTKAAKAVDRRSPPPRRRASSDEAASGSLLRARSVLAQRRRPILLGLAALVLIVGALEVVKLGADPVEATRISEAPARTRLASAATAANPDAARTAELPQPVLPPAAPPTPAPLPTFVTGPVKAPAPADGIPEGLRTAAAAGDAAAQYEVGLRYSEGRGTPRDPKQAVAWFSKAAAAASAPAEYRLGSAYEKGAGVDRDPALAMSWYGKAADAGNIRAMHNLAVMSADGAGGKPDYARAAQWFGKASTYGVRDSQFNLAILYARGLGIEQSLPQSYTWFAIAAAGGDEDAAKKRDEVAGKLDAKALASAKAAAEAFHAAVPSALANEVAPPSGGWDAAPPRPPTASPAVNANAKVSQL